MFEIALILAFCVVDAGSSGGAAAGLSAALVVISIALFDVVPAPCPTQSSPPAMQHAPFRKARRVVCMDEGLRMENGTFQSRKFFRFLRLPLSCARSRVGYARGISRRGKRCGVAGLRLHCGER